MRPIGRRHPIHSPESKGFAPLPILALAITLFCAAGSPQAVVLSKPGIQSDVVSFSFDSAPGQLFVVQSAASLSSPEWLEAARYGGTGSPIVFSAPVAANQRFFRVQVSPLPPLKLDPDAPALTTGEISLPDAVAGLAYAQKVSAGSTGLAPYVLQITGSPPDGVTLSVEENNTGNAAVQITSTGAGLMAGQRRQFEISVVDSLNTTNVQKYDLRVVMPAPRMTVESLVFKAGEAVNIKLASEGGVAPLSWSAAPGSLPSGLQLSVDGTLTGTPSVDAAEFNETGKHTTMIEVSDSLADRLTGAVSPRRATNSVETLVRLSYRLNIRSGRPNGPSLQESCFACHGSGFQPDFEAPSALAVLGVPGGSGGACDSSRVYISPGNPSDSLIYRKLSAQPPCGDRMPLGGPYFSDQRLERLARWIRELRPTDTD